MNTKGYRLTKRLQALAKFTAKAGTCISDSKISESYESEHNFVYEKYI